MRERLQVNSHIIIRNIDVLDVIFCLIWCHTSWGWIMFVRVVDSCQSNVLGFLSISVGIPLSSNIPSEYLFFSYTFRIISQCSWLWRGWWLPWRWDWWRSCPLPWWRESWWGLTMTGCRRGVRWMWSFSSWIGRWSQGGGGGGGGAFLSPFINYFKYLSSRARWAHYFNNPNLSTVGAMILMLCTKKILLE